MERYEIKIPSLYSNYECFCELIKIAYEVRGFQHIQCHFNFEECTFFAGNLCTILGSIFSMCINQNNLISASFPENNTLVNYLINNEFLPAFDKDKYKNPSKQKTYIPYRIFTYDQIYDFDSYIEKELFSNENMPKMQKELQKDLKESLNEIFANASDHSHYGNRIFTCGQSFFNTSKPRLVFTIVDNGIGFAGNINGKFGYDWSGAEAISWATKIGNTTKDFIGGFGYEVIKGFINANNGKIQIFSNNGYWEYNGKKNMENPDNEILRDLNTSFNGAIINIDFMIDDYYYCYRK